MLNFLRNRIQNEDTFKKILVLNGCLSVKWNISQSQKRKVMFWFFKIKNRTLFEKGKSLQAKATSIVHPFVYHNYLVAVAADGDKVSKGSDSLNCGCVIYRYGCVNVYIHQKRKEKLLGFSFHVSLQIIYVNYCRKHTYAFIPYQVYFVHFSIISWIFINCQSWHTKVFH